MNVLIPLPDRDFDVTEVAVPWRLLTRSNHQITFATEHGGAPPAADPRLLTGVVFGRLGAAPEPIAFYGEMCASSEFRSPLPWMPSTRRVTTARCYLAATPLACASTSVQRFSKNA